MSDIKFRELPADNELKIGEPILIKVKDPRDIHYYVVVPDEYHNEIQFVEACGEQIASWTREEIAGYIPFSELDRIPIEEQVEEKEADDRDI